MYDIYVYIFSSSIPVIMCWMNKYKQSVSLDLTVTWPCIVAISKIHVEENLLIFV